MPESIAMYSFPALQKKALLYIGIINILAFAMFNYYVISNPISFTTRTNFILPYIHAKDNSSNRQLWDTRILITHLTRVDAMRDGYKWSFWESADEKNIFFDVETPVDLAVRENIDSFVNEYVMLFCDEVKSIVDSMPAACMDRENFSALEQAPLQIGDQEYFPPRYEVIFEGRRNVLPASQALFMLYFISANVFLLILYGQERRTLLKAHSTLMT